ncbi:hypothetical protein CC80DRAFT_422473 [Byssothecium circinans]|uniref:DUF3176 domain containing protein n=1 Tax=Byssothecium circinans TaxID=147558 RepID=A0A6A5TLE0_9PLEO|nr:hypothetical protein CC80DRAFT_422473 [Byssothecium circinans]
MDNPPPYTERKSSLDITQKLERKLAGLNASENVFKRWIYEIVTWTISALCMAAIIVVLMNINNRSLAGRTTLVTTYSVLSKLASAALLLPTSEALGQLKWNWLRSREIWDFEIFDKASRGAWGSILLLFRTKGRSLAALGAALTLLLIANDTFFQQVVDLPERWSLESNRSSSIARIVRYEPQYDVTYKKDVQVSNMDQYVKPTLERFFYGNGTQPVPFGNGTRPDIPLSCPSSNCTFPEYNTLGACSRCTDVSALLEFGCRTAKVDWVPRLEFGYNLASFKYPNGSMCGYFLNLTSSMPVLMSGYMTSAISSTANASVGEALLLRILTLSDAYPSTPLWGGSVNFKDIQHALAKVIVVGAADGVDSVHRNVTPIAKECMLAWCVKRVRSSYQYATYREEIVSEFLNTTSLPYPWTSQVYTSVDVNGTEAFNLRDVDINPPGDAQSYGMRNDSHVNVYLNFDDIFPSFLTAVNATTEPKFRYQTRIKGPLFRQIHMNPWVAPNNITHHFERLAMALTNLLRSSDSGEPVSGSAYKIETFIHVQWAWLTFPFTLLFLSLLFLVATMIKTSGKGDNGGPGAWKTSAMPTLIYGLPSELQKQFISPTAGRTTMPDDAKKVRIKLHPTKGWRVSGHPLSPDSPVVVFRSNQPPPGWI